MLTTLAIDNFRCFQNLEFRPAKLHAVFGPNGSGKTSLIEALRLIRAFVCEGKSLGSLFPTSSLTRWDRRNEQTFLVCARLEEHEFRLEFAIEHDRSTFQSRIAYERFWVDNKTLFASEMGQAQLYRDEGTAGPKVNFDWTRSGISMVAPGPDNRFLTQFRNWVWQLTFVDVVPAIITGRTEEESSILETHALNFASWYRHLSQSSPLAVASALKQLSRVIPGFRQFKLVGDFGRLRQLQAWFRDSEVGLVKNGPEYGCAFEELSDGQKCLAVLYCVLESLRDTNRTVIFDEPDNYVASGEIQPFLSELQMVLEDGAGQAIVTSHHPDLINGLATDEASWIDRPSGYQSRVQPFRFDESTGILPAEAVARGWNNE